MVSSFRVSPLAALCLSALLPLAGLKAQSTYAPPYTFTTFAGTALNYGQDDGTGAAASFDGPRSVAVDSQGNVFVVDKGNHTIRKITPGRVVTTFAGIADDPGSDDGTLGVARFNTPVGLAIDSSDNLYVSDWGNNTIRKITPAGVVSTLAGTASAIGGDTDDTGPAASFDGPHGVAVDAAGNVFVADSNNSTIRKITPAGVVTTYAGDSGFPGSTDTGGGGPVRFNAPYAVAVDAAGNVFVADTNNNAIRKIDFNGVVTTIAGSTIQASGSLDATGTAATFNAPTDVEVDASGNLYVTDAGNTIRRIAPDLVVTTLAGTANSNGHTDGTGGGALFWGPQGVAVDALGNLYVADVGNATIRTQPAQTTALAINSPPTGTYGVAYTATVSPGGDGTGALVWSLGAGSTAGGAAINSSTGVVTFTSPGTVVFRVSKSADPDFHSQTTGDFTLTVGKATQATLSVNSSASGTYLAAYTATATGGSGGGAISWALGTGSTAPGAAIDSSTGAVTSTGAGTVVVNVTKATDTNYLAATSADYTITLGKATQAALSVNSSASGTFGSAYSATATGGSGGGALSWSLGTGSTAPGAAIDSNTGAVTSTGAGTVVINVTKATDANYLAATSADFTITLGKATQAGLDVSGNSATGTFGTAYTATYTGGSGTGAVTWTYVPGSAPGGAIDSSTGAVTSTGAGTVVFFVTKAADANYLSEFSPNFTVTLGKAGQAALSVNSSATGTYLTPYTATYAGGSGTGGITWALGTGSTAPGAAIDSSTGEVTSTGPGTVVVNVTKATDANYLVATSSDFTVTLAKATQATLSVNSSASGTFGTAYTATYTGGSGGGAISWALGTGSTAPGAAIDSSTGAVTSTGAGTVVVNVTKATDSEYLAATSADFTVTLGKAAQATLSVNSSPTGTFGTIYTATSTGGSGTGAITWSLGTGSTAPDAAVNSTSGVISSTGAGTVVIKVTKATDADYLVATSSDFTITLAKATQAALSVSSSATGTYLTAYTATASGGSGTGALAWALGTGSTAPGAAIDSSTGAVTSTGTGTVVVKVTKAADADYLVATSTDFTITLGKAAQAALSVTSSATGTYLTSYTATATGGTGTGALTWALGTGSTAPGAAIDSSTGAVTSTGAGTVVINITKATDTNYLVATSADFTVTLGKAAQAVLNVTSSATGTYLTPYTATATGGSGTGGLSWALGTGSTAPGAAIDSSTGAVTSTGTGTVVIKVTKATDANYLVATSSDFTITLAKAAQATLSVNSSASGTYLTPYTATSAGGSGTGGLSWALGTGSTAPGAAIDSTTGAVTSTGTGTVVVNVTKATDANYLVATSADFTVTLSKATQSALSVNSSATGTFGSAYTATSAGGSGTGTLTWALGTGSTAPGAAIDSSTGAVTSTGAGTVVINVTKATDANYLVATSVDFTITLAKATQASLSVSSSASGTYLTPYTATATGGSGTGGLTWALGAGSTAAGAAIDASTGVVTSTGAGTVVIKVTKATDANYLVATSADFTITLAKATQAALSVSSPATGTFGSTYIATATGGSGTGALTWALGTGSTAAGAAIDATTGAVTSTGAGTVVINATKATDTNYLAATSSDFTVTLNAANATVTLGSLTATYDGSAHAATATTVPASLTVTFTYNGSATVPTNAGSYAVVATISDSNYTGTASGSLVIAKAAPVITWATPAGIQYGVALSATQLNATASVAGAFVYNPASGAVVNPGSQTLIANFTPTDTVNYTSVSTQRTLVVTVDSRIPAGFDIAGYYARNPDVQAVFGADTYGAWLYYHDHGIYQGEFFDDAFRVEEYLALYPELFAIFGTDLGAALDHWLSTGRIEGKLGRIPVEFSAQGYFDRNPDVAAATNNNTVLAWGHYWAYGIYEGRAYDNELRVFEYLAINADLTAAFVNDWRQAALHWMRYGRTEGRLGRIPLTFDVAEYLVRNPDVLAIFGSNPTTVFLHYWLFGLDEARTYDDLFRVDEYLALNPDLAAVFGSNRQGAYKHWVRYGQSEGRPGKNP